MRCPFLKETRVRYCEISPIRKMVPRDSIAETAQRCTSGGYRACPLALARLGPASAAAQPAAQCPFLRESLVQYCAAAGVTKFIPYNDALLSRCNGHGHRHCALFLQHARPEDEAPDALAVPDQLAYTPNHMWLDVGEGGQVSIGVDAFTTRLLGSVERVAFLSPRSLGRPRVVLSAGSFDLPLLFPMRVNITATNTLLRSRPQLLVEDPYGAGWLFEGTDPHAGNGGGNGAADLEAVRGAEVRPWMDAESERLSRFVHTLHARRCQPEEVLMADGGRFSSSLIRHLDREELLQLVHQFFAIRDE